MTERPHILRPRAMRSRPQLTLRRALSDPSLLGNVLRGPSWEPWKVLLLAAVGERLTDDERAIFARLTGRAHEPRQQIEELIAVIGRRGGKSRAISVLATYIAALCRHPALTPGETGVVLVIAPDMEQADIIFTYINAIFRQSPMLSQLVEGQTAREIRLTNGINIAIRSSDFRRLRGPTYVCVIGDEAAFWMTSENSSNPDTEILNAVRPGLATTGGPLILISSPYARRGVVWDAYRRHFGERGDPLVLVARGSSRTFNPSLPQSVVDRAMERDPASASAEFGAEFRTDIETFITIEALRACVSRGVYERAPKSEHTYRAFCDPSGGSSDSMTLGIGHYDFRQQSVILDCVREGKPPFSPEAVVQEFSETLRNYRVTDLRGDRYAGIWPAELFAKNGVTYTSLDTPPKSDLYRDLLPLINSSRLDLLDHPKLIQQLTGLERRTGRGGRDSIDHAPNGKDDLANAAAGLAHVCAAHGNFDPTYRGFQPDYNDNTTTPAQDPNKAWRRARYAAYVMSGGMRPLF